MAHQPIVIAGHSHVFVFQFGSTAVNNPAGMVPLPMPREDVYGFATLDGPYVGSYWDALVANAAGKTIVLFWLGSQHLAEFLFEPEESFDFVLAQKPDLPLRPDAQLVAESLIRTYQKTFLKDLPMVLERLLAQPGCRVCLAATAPPKGNDGELRALIAGEPYFQNLAATLGLDLATITLTDRFVRLKLWLTIQDLIRNIAREQGIDYLPVPPAVLDEDGFLRREYWEIDVGHANHSYGLVFFDEIMSLIQKPLGV